MNQERIELPELTPEAVSRIEQQVFRRIADETAPPRTTDARRATRRRRWTTGLGIAAAFVVGMVVAPTVIGIGSAGSGPFGAAGGTSADTAVSRPASDAASGVLPQEEGAALDGDMAVEREIIANGMATLEADDVEVAVSAIAALAEAHGGFVERTSVTAPRASDAHTESFAGDGWIRIRVPSADLNAVIEALGESGTVVSSEIGKEDVTMAAIDLRARVDALQDSVDRLRELMAETGSLSELIDAEVALTERQAELESYQQQLAALEDQIALAALDVDVVPRGSAVSADPAGFGDGLLAGWNGLIVSLNALVIALGFLLPWLAIAGVVILLVWVLRRRRRPRAEREDFDTLR